MTKNKIEPKEPGEIRKELSALEEQSKKLLERIYKARRLKDWQMVEGHAHLNHVEAQTHEVTQASIAFRQNFKRFRHKTKPPDELAK